VINKMKHPKHQNTPQPKNTKWNWLLIGILVVGFCLRLQGLTASVTDWHSFRQVDTASVTQEYVSRGVDLLHPRYHDLGNTQSGKDNPEGYRMVEFPWVNALLAVILRALPFLDLVVISRLFSILCSVGTIACLYQLGKRWGNETIGYLSALTFALLPYAVYYSRVILPEPIFTFTLTLAVLGFEDWLEKKRWASYGVSLVSLTLALLLKPFALFFAPVFAYLALRHFKTKVFFQPALYVFAVCLVPLVLWREWIKQFPEGIPASDWLFNKNGIRLRPAWFRWLGWERYTKLILGGVGIVAAVASLGEKTKLRELILVWGGCVLAYLVVIAGGNVQHDYYQSITLPVVSLAVGQGLYFLSKITHPAKLLGLVATAAAIIFLITRIPQPDNTPALQVPVVIIAAGIIFSGYLLYLLFKRQQTPLAGVLAAGGLLLTSVTISNWFVRGYYSTRSDYEQAGAAVQRLTTPDDKVIAPAMTDTMFLFQTQRRGWTLGGEIEDKISKGATYYVNTAYDDEAKALEQKYQVVEKTPNHIIIKLLPANPPISP
jgi:hypothetical protein